MGWVDGRLTFRYADPDHRLAGVRLAQHAGLPTDRLDFDYRDQAWLLDVPAPAAWRLEYQLKLRHLDGREEWVNDPANPARVGGAFGDKSVLRRADYVEPDLVATKDGHLIARHEPDITNTTDVGAKFPGRETTKIVDGVPTTGFFAFSRTSAS